MRAQNFVVCTGKTIASAVLLLLIVGTPVADASVQWTGKSVGRIQPPDANRDCVFFELAGVTQADPAVPSGGSWFAVHRDHYGFKEIYALLIWAKSTGAQISVATTGAPTTGACAAYVGVTYVYTTF